MLSTVLIPIIIQRSYQPQVLVPLADEEVLDDVQRDDELTEQQDAMTPSLELWEKTLKQTQLRTGANETIMSFLERKSLRFDVLAEQVRVLNDLPQLHKHVVHV